jgi:hypothetical protein
LQAKKDLADRKTISANSEYILKVQGCHFCYEEKVFCEVIRNRQPERGKKIILLACVHGAQKKSIPEQKISARESGRAEIHCTPSTPAPVVSTGA